MFPIGPKDHNCNPTWSVSTVSIPKWSTPTWGIPTWSIPTGSIPRKSLPPTLNVETVNNPSRARDLCSFCERLSRWLCVNGRNWQDSDQKLAHFGDYMVLHASVSTDYPVWPLILESLPGRAESISGSKRIRIDFPIDRFVVIFERNEKLQDVSAYLEFFRPIGKLPCKLFYQVV